MASAKADERELIRTPEVELTQAIVVGVDGSAGSAAALRWGLAEACLRGAPLDVVHAYQLPPGDGRCCRCRARRGRHGGRRLGGRGPASGSVGGGGASGSSEQTLEQANGDVTGVELERTVIEGAPAPVLIDAGRDAALLVLFVAGCL